MPFNYHINTENKTVFVKAKGEVDIHDCKNAVAEVIAAPGFHSGLKVLVDLREMKYLPSTADIRILASMLGDASESFTTRVAIVVPNVLLFGMARMAQAYAEIAGFSMSPFQDYELALKWVLEE